MARMTAMCWWSEGAIMASSPAMTRGPPAKAMKICEADAQQGQRQREVERHPLEAAAAPDEVADHERREARAHAVDVADVGGLGDRLVPGHQQHRREVAAPHRRAEEDEDEHEAAEEHGAVREQPHGDEGDRRHVVLVQHERDQQEAAEHDHADDHGRPPLLGLVRVQAERQQEQGHARGQQEDAEQVDLDAVVQHRSPGEADLDLGQQLQLPGLPLVPEEQGAQRQHHHRGDDGEDAEPPAPAGPGEDAVGHGAADPGGDDIGRRGEREHQGPVLQGGGVGDEDGDAVAHALGTIVVSC
ncbi:hypothetical protein VTK73DRAFT_6425 [Phialemonium thermophilum]|uniref:Uncharacterized protein n=1 Tax=Phialemonium thermophilum TaxID=223376 RepID=A0ABR3UZI1_9PEZI